MLCNFFLQFSRFEVSTSKDTLVSKSNIARFEAALLRLQAQEPIQYILGCVAFYGLTFKVNKHTLIPRPETEELVDWMVSDFQNQDTMLDILDLGTGSGCIAIALAKNLPKTSLSAIDISENALVVAQENALKNQVLVSFCQKDIVNTNCLEKKYDVIVSNPPYVRQSEKKAMSANVLEYEPSTALFVPNEDPLLFYRKIAQLAQDSLHSKGWLYFEINEYLGEDTKALFSSTDFDDLQLKTDIFGKHRMIRATKR